MRPIASNKLRPVDHPELALAREPERRGVPHYLIHTQKHASAAVCLACQTSGLDDKEIYLSLGVDASQWSRIKKGESNFPADKIAAFCAVVGNNVYPEWIAYQVGCGLVMLRSEAERRADALKVELDRERETTALLKGLLIGQAA